MLGSNSPSEVESAAETTELAMAASTTQVTAERLAGVGQPN